MFRIATVAIFILFATPAVTWSADEATSRDDLQAMREQLADRLSPTEAMLLQRIDEMERKVERRNPWLQPTVVIAFVAALVGWGLAVWQFFGNQNLRIWELMLESLRWFEGGTQRRSIGIALVESKWDVHKEFRGRWASILMNQAIYLLTREKHRDAIHERANLYRIMNLLMEKVDPSGEIAGFERVLLCDTLTQYDPKSDRGLINLDSKRLGEWQARFCAPIQQTLHNKTVNPSGE